MFKGRSGIIPGSENDLETSLQEWILKMKSTFFDEGLNPISFVVLSKSSSRSEIFSWSVGVILVHDFRFDIQTCLFQIELFTFDIG